MSVNIKTIRSVKLELLLILTSITIVIFLAFIDEGYYNFNWIFDPGSLGFLVILGLVLYALHYLIFSLILGKLEIIGKVYSILVIIVLLGSIFKLSIENS